MPGMVTMISMRVMAGMILHIVVKAVMSLPCGHG
jgi:hypothetical protein